MIKRDLATLTECSEVLDKPLPIERDRISIFLAVVRIDVVKDQQRGLASVFLDEAPDAQSRNYVAVSMYDRMVRYQGQYLSARVVVANKFAPYRKLFDAASGVVPSLQRLCLLEGSIYAIDRSFDLFL